jgi:hypothetical protein
MNKVDSFVKKYLEKDGWYVWGDVPGQLAIRSQKAHSMHVYISTRVGSTFPNKVQITVQNLTNSSDYKTIFEKYDRVVLEWEPLGTSFDLNILPIGWIPPENYPEDIATESSNCDIMSETEFSGTLDSMFE